MMSAINPVFLRWGGAALCILVLAYVITGITDLADGWRRRGDAAMAALAPQRQAIDAAQIWADARRSVERDAQRLDALLWQAASEGQARAAIQDFLSRSLITEGVDRPMVRIDRVTATAVRDRFLVQVTVGGAIPLPALERWLGGLARSDRLITVDRLRVQSLPTARFEAVLMLPVSVRAGS
jgi:hypothetical protein